MDQRAKSFCLYALFLVRCQDYVKAEKFFIRSIQTMASPHALTEYLYFLDRCNLSFFAEHTYRCIVEKTVLVYFCHVIYYYTFYFILFYFIMIIDFLLRAI